MSVYNDGTAKATTTGYIQSSLLVSDAYKAGEGKLYIYGSCNEENGTINFFKYDVANHTFDTGVTKELYTPTGAEKQYNLCSLICDAAARSTSRTTPATSLPLPARSSRPT